VEKRRTEENEEFLSALIACSPVALYSVDLGGVVQSWNESATRIFGWTAKEVNGTPLPIVPPEVRDEYTENLQRAVESGGFFGKEMTRLRKDGSLVPISLSVAPIRDAAGEIVGIVGAAEDITERNAMNRRLRETLREKDTLLRELFHRTNNTLQVIRSTMALRTAVIDEPVVSRFAGEIDRKILTIALIHQKLYEEATLTRIDLATFVDEMASDILAGIPDLPVSITVEAASLYALIDIAIPLGLVLNELIDAVIAAAEEDNQPREMTIALDRSQEKMLVCAVASHGGTSAANDLRPDELGWEIVAGLVERQLGGSIEWSDGQCMVRVPEDRYVPRV